MFYLNLIFSAYKEVLTTHFDRDRFEWEKKPTFYDLHFSRYATFFKAHWRNRLWQANKHRRSVKIIIFYRHYKFFLYFTYAFFTVIRVKPWIFMYIFIWLADRYNYFEGVFIKPARYARKVRKKFVPRYFEKDTFQKITFKNLKLNKHKSFSFSFFKSFKGLPYSVLFKPSNLVNLFNNYSLDKININFLRKNKVFNKGRYSRNRQYYRTGVYWCLYINIVAVLGFYFWFYKVSLNFGYLWWLLWIFFCSFFLPKFLTFLKTSNPVFIFKDIFNDLVEVLSILQLKINDYLFLNKLISKKTLFSGFYFGTFII